MILAALGMLSKYREIIPEQEFAKVSWSMIILASTFVLVRLSIQIWRRKMLDVQDSLVYFAFACFLAMSVCYFIAIPTAYRLGDVNVGLVKPWPTMVNDQISTVRLMFVTTVLFWVSLWSVKLSLLALYKKLIQGQPATYTRFWWALLVFCLVVSDSHKHTSLATHLYTVSCRVHHIPVDFLSRLQKNPK
jgi:hypothetical protein